MSKEQQLQESLAKLEADSDSQEAYEELASLASV